jgi:transcription initiation factor TFIIF subunit beta
MAAAPNGPKIEGNVDGSFLSVKPEPGSLAASPAVQYEEEDIYEDTGDLDFTEAGRDVWLCRIPKFLFENWKDLQDGDDEQLKIGTVRIEKDEKNKEKYKRVCVADF